MKQVVRWSSISVALCLMAAVVGCGAPVAKAGHVAPSFSLPSMSTGKTVSLQQLSHGEPIILNAFASWCGPCQQETPELVALAKQYQGKVEVVGINMTSTDNETNARKFVQQYGLPYTVLLDPEGVFMKDYQVVGLPTTFLLSPNGDVEKVIPQMMTSAQMKSLFEDAANLTHQS